MKMSIDKLKKMLNKQETILSYVYCSVQLTHSSRSGLLVATDKKSMVLRRFYVWKGSNL